MSEKPILFSGEMVRAILDGRKTQTRRVINPQPDHFHTFEQGVLLPQIGDKEIVCPYGNPGDQLWVRETWRCEELDPYGEDGVRFRADNVFRVIENTQAASSAWGEAHRDGGKWRPSIFMPRWASRITLEVVNVRVERVQDISEADAMAEGFTSPGAKLHFCKLWDEINGKRGFGWDVNPWVWVVEFKKFDIKRPSAINSNLLIIDDPIQSRDDVDCVMNAIKNIIKVTK